MSSQLEDSSILEMTEEVECARQQSILSMGEFNLDGRIRRSRLEGLLRVIFPTAY